MTGVDTNDLRRWLSDDNVALRDYYNHSASRRWQVSVCAVRNIHQRITHFNSFTSGGRSTDCRMFISLICRIPAQSSLFNRDITIRRFGASLWDGPIGPIYLLCNQCRHVEPLTNDHPHQRPSLSYDHISCDGQWFLFVYESLKSDHPSYTTTPMWLWGWSYKRGSTVIHEHDTYI